MKEFDRHVVSVMNELADKESWDDVNWGKISFRLFGRKYTPAKYKNMRIRNEDEWRNFICYYSMQKVRIDADWLSKELKERKPDNKKKEENIDLDEIFDDALKEIKAKKAV